MRYTKNNFISCLLETGGNRGSKDISVKELSIFTINLDIPKRQNVTKFDQFGLFSQHGNNVRASSLVRQVGIVIIIKNLLHEALRV